MITNQGRKGITLMILALMMVTYTITISSVPITRFNVNLPKVPESPTYLEAVFSLQTFTGTKTVTPIASPDNSYENLQQFLYTADESLYIEIYGINSPYILNDLHRIYKANPNIDMKVLIGDSSLGYGTPNDYVAWNLTQLGVPVRWTSDVWVYTHAKFIMINNDTTIVQSGNWAKTSFDPTLGNVNREFSLIIEDSAVTGYYLNVFSYDWAAGTDYVEDSSDGDDPLTYSSYSHSYPIPFTETQAITGPMNVTPVFSNDTSLDGILQVINRANYTIQVEIPYFTNVGDGDSVDDIMQALTDAADAGVDVRVLTEDEKDYAQMASDFESHGIAVKYLHKWFSALHNKAIIVDGELVLVCSINFSDNSVENNREAGVIIENKNITDWFMEVFEYDWNIAVDGNLFIDNWGPAATAKYSPGYVDNETAVTVNAFVVDESGLNTAVVTYRVDGGLWNNKTLTINENNSSASYTQGSQTIPAQAVGANVAFKIIAEDNLGQWTTSRTYKYTVQTVDTSGPSISAFYYPKPVVTLNDSAGIVATVLDPSGVDQVTLSYMLNSNGIWFNSSMVQIGGKHFGMIPKQANETVVHFKIYANDTNDNWSTSTTLGYTVGVPTEPPEPPNGEPEPLDPLTIALIIGAVIAVAVIGFFMQRQRSSSGKKPASKSKQTRRKKS